MKKIVLIMTALLTLSVPSFSQDGPTKKVAILETVDREGTISYGVKLMLRSSLSYAITNTPGYEGYDRVDLESIVGEQTFQRTGMVSDEQIKKLGEMTGASYILVAEAAKVDDTHIFITAKILNVETAKLESTANVQTLTDAKDMEEGCRKLAALLLGTETDPDAYVAEQESETESPAGIWDMKVSELIAQQAESQRARQEARQAARQEKAAERAEARAAADMFISSVEDNRTVPEGIYPGMKYSQYRKLYNASDYVRMPGDRYSPLAGGLCSFVIPGLGQAINGNVGRGLAFFGGAVLGSALMISGSAVMGDAYYYNTYGYAVDEETMAAATTMVVAGLVTLVGFDIWAIIDGVNHAKIKNMYLRDVTGISSLDIKLSPYIASTAVPFSQGISPALGLSLNVSF